MTYKCTNCDAYKRSKYEAGCYGSCGKRDCRECCESCGQHTLISMEIVKITDELSVSVDNPIFRTFSKYISEVNDSNHWRQECHITIDKWNVKGYWGPTTQYTYRRGDGITRFRVE